MVFKQPKGLDGKLVFPESMMVVVLSIKDCSMNRTSGRPGS